MPVLTQAQIDAYWRDGYVAQPEILSAAELERIRKGPPTRTCLLIFT